MADWREEAERWWAAVLGLPVTAFRVGGIFPASGFDHLGVLTVPGAAAPVVYGPVSSVPVLHALQELAAATGGLDTSDLDAVPGLRAGRVVGPAWYGYPTASSLSALSGPAVRPLTAAGLGLLARLHAAAPPAEVTESGTGGLPAFGYLDDGELLAVACPGYMARDADHRRAHPSAGPLPGIGAGRRDRSCPGRPQPPAGCAVPRLAGGNGEAGQPGIAP